MVSSEEDCKPDEHRAKRRRTTDRSATKPAAKVSRVDASFFAPASQKPKSELQISQSGLCFDAVYKPAELSKWLEGKTQIKVAAFDLDGTLIKTQSGNRFAKSGSDWQFWHGSVPTKLRSLHSDGYLLVIFSNQGGCSPDKERGRTKLEQLKQKFRLVTEAIGVPLYIFAALGYDDRRKPNTGMWRALEKAIRAAAVAAADEQADDAQVIDMAASCFVGDAAGRPIGSGGGDAGKDFSDSDRKFALNLGLTFHTPEEYFLGVATADYHLTFDAARYGLQDQQTMYSFERLDKLELVVLVGSPASGKSSFVRTVLAPLGYERVNRDLLGDMGKCVSAARDALQAGDSVVVDNTSPSAASRAAWIALAKELGATPRCVHLSADAAVCKHNNWLRIVTQADAPPTDDATGGVAIGGEKRELLPEIAIASYRKNFEPPKATEGFKTIDVVPFVVDEGINARWRQHYT